MLMSQTTGDPMIQKMNTILSSDSRIRLRRVQRLTFSIGFIFIIVCISQAAALPTVMYPLKPSPANGPYQDSEFLELANETIYGLSNTTIPNGTSLRELQSTQQRLAKMNISPGLYPTAKQINAYLYYASKSGDELSDALSLADKPYSPVYRDDTMISEARKYQVASQTVWSLIKSLYPGVVPYTLSSQVNPTPTEEAPYFWPKSPFSDFSGDLW